MNAFTQNEKRKFPSCFSGKYMENYLRLSVFTWCSFMTWPRLTPALQAGGCQLSGPGSLQREERREEVVECRDQRSEKFSPALSGPSCVPGLAGRAGAAWEIEHYESNVESCTIRDYQRTHRPTGTRKNER